MNELRDGVDDPIREAAAGAAPRQSRRLADKVLVTVHHACDQGELDAAAQLLHIAELLISRPGGAPDIVRRRNIDALVAAHERLWHLRHPGKA